MSMPGDAFKTYETIGLREDLGNLISMLSPVDTPFYNSLSEGGAANTVVEWQIDALGNAGANAAVEGDDESVGSVTPTTRVSNVTQIQKKSFALSNTNASANMKRAGRVSEKDYQTAKIGKELSKDIEYAFLTGTKAVGDASNARVMRGILNWCVTNISYGSGGSVNSTTGVAVAGTDREITSDLLTTVLQNIYVNGGNPDTMYVTASLKPKISGWVQSTSNYRVAVDGAKLQNTIDVYVSDFGTVSIKAHRGMPAKTALILDSSHKGKKGTLRNIHREQLAITGDNQKWVMRVEHTLRDVEEVACGRMLALI